jgi:hypothetical protein
VTCSFNDVQHELSLDIADQTDTSRETRAIFADLEVTEDELIVRATSATGLLRTFGFDRQRLSRHSRTHWVLGSPGLFVAFGFLDLHVTQKLMEADGERSSEEGRECWAEAARLLSSGEVDRMLVPDYDEVEDDADAAAVRAGVLAAELPSVRVLQRLETTMFMSHCAITF